MKSLAPMLQRMLERKGYRIQDIRDLKQEAEFTKIKEKIQGLTMTSQERQFALFKATQYITEQGIEGDIVECGVWKGGSSMIIADALQARGDTDRTLYLYDTFAGMSEPTDKDVNQGKSALEKWKTRQRSDFNEWDYAPLDEVRKNLARTGYPAEKIIYVAGKVEDTIPKTIPERIALLRLDTDWYESTRHELEQLFPRLSVGGVLIIDDYGHWDGARQAVDEYFKNNNIQMFLNRIDYTGRLGIKVSV